MTFRRLVLFLVPVALLQAQQDRVTRRIDNAQMLPLRGAVHKLANAQNDHGAVAGTFPLPGITLLLKSSSAQRQDLQALLDDQRNPTSGNFHKWLTPEQYADRFGASAADIARISDWLKSQGFTVTGVARGRNWISFDGTAARVDAAFHTSIHRYTVNGEQHFANSTEPAIPAALADVVAGFRGLHDFRMKPRSKRTPVPDLTQGGSHYVAPDDFATIYDVAPLYKAGINGSGQSITVVGQTQIRTSDLTSFRSQFNLGTLNLQQVKVPSRPNPGVQSGDIDEANLDIEWSGAVARNATIVYVYSDDVWQSAMYAVDQNFAPIISMSYGQCEDMDLAILPSQQALVQQANAEGITWLGPAGDAGAADCEVSGVNIAQSGLAVDVPASIPEITAMGGTEFNDGASYWSSSNGASGGSALGYIPERVWNDSLSASGLSAGGGGASLFFPQPPWQTGPGVPTDGVRHVPDLSLNASLDHDPLIFVSGGTGFVGGTSAAVPTMAGIVSLLNQYLVSTGAQQQPGLGNINPTLYRLAQTTTDVFHDVVIGDNMVPCVDGSPDCNNGMFGYPAGPNYDQASGWGSVDALNLVHRWTGALPANSVVVASIDQKPVFQLAQPDRNGNQWSFKLTLNEEAGIATTLTDFAVNGTSMAAQIPQLFGGAAIPARGSISASYGFASLAVPATVAFTFAGVDAGGQPWTLELDVPFQGPQIPLAATSFGNAASGQAVYAPGMLLTIIGTGLADFPQTEGTVPWPQFMAGFQASINGVQVPLQYVSPTQVNVQIPYETQVGPATLELDNPYQTTTYNFQVSATGPGIFTLADGTINPSSSAGVGQTATLFITGEGQVSPALADGSAPAPGTPSARLPKPRLPVSVIVAGNQALSTVIGVPVGMVGVTEITFTVPPNTPPGRQPVVVTVGTVSSQTAFITVTQ